MNADEARIYQDGDHIGDLYRQTDILDPASSYYVIHLEEDSRGPVRVGQSVSRVGIEEVQTFEIDVEPDL